VIDSSVTVLTNIGLEHTRWLGPTLRDIAEEKLAVVPPGSTLVLGADLVEPARAVATRVARERGARIVHADAETRVWPLLARGAFQQRNFELARVAAEAYLARARPEQSPCDEQAVRDAAASTIVRGRLQIVDGNPLTVLDGAHNPDAAAALVASLPAVLGGRSLGLVLGVLDDKDAVGMLRVLLPACERAWFTAPASSRALPPAALESLARQLGFERVVCAPEPARALDGARTWALARSGAVLATGSVYLVGDLIAEFEGRESARGGQPGARRGTSI
jgi:dihydrofolate synthase / folylpolyglutamate synthase